MYIISEYEFSKEFTFIGRVNRITPGRVFTALTGNKFFGFWKDRINVVWHDGLIHMDQKDPSFAMLETAMKGEYLTTYTYTSSNTKCKLYN